MRASLIRSALVLSLSVYAFPALASDAAAAAPAAGAVPAAAASQAPAAEAPAAAAPAAKRSCEDVKSGIEAKIKARGVKAFTLDIAEKDATVEGKVVGTCEGGSKKIVYKRG